jgi:predicted enzyme related to lactoylglutathione lyase
MKNGTKRPDVVVWFEIPAADFGRAVGFYEKVFARKLKTEKIGKMDLAVFPYDRELAISGCVLAGEGHKPAADGTMVYINVDDDLDDSLERVWSAGGRVTQPKTALPPGMGFFAHFIDSEGNRVGLHSVR